MRTAFLASLCGLLFVGTLIVSAQSTVSPVEGTWKTTHTNDDGNTASTVYQFHASDGRLTGQVEVAWGNLSIEQGTISDGRFAFQIHMGESIWKYDGQVKDGNLSITVHDPNMPAATLSATRLTEEQSRFVAIPPPPLHVVPSNGLAKTPLMGWNSWNYFQGRITDAIVRQIADAMVSSGMRDAGYTYINIDDTWEGPRDSSGQLHPNKKFADMKALADYVHARGLKLGLYSSPGTETCAGYPGSYGHEEQDAATFAAWGIDYLKYDWCSAFRLYPDGDMRAIYQRMGDALRKTGRPVVFSISSGGKEHVWTWGRLAGANLWRTTDDINPGWKRIENIGFSQSELAQWSGPGGWNDPDMLEVGNGHLTPDEQRTHMSLWALLAAPLITGNDLRSMSAETAAILTNREVIAIDQDALGIAGRHILQLGSIEVWTKQLASHQLAVGIFNRADHAQVAEFDWNALGLNHPAQARDLWQHKDIPLTGDRFWREIPAHGTVLLRFWP